MVDKRSETLRNHHRPVANNPPIIVNKVPLTGEQRGHLQNLLAHPGYSILKQVLVARTIEFQVESMNCALYPGNIAASELVTGNKESAQRLQAVLDELDALEVLQHEWSLVELMARR